jgi:cytoskeletal protein CcmA (bactofilin family)
MRRYVLMAFALAVVAVVVLAPPAAAARGGSNSNDRRISVSGGVVVTKSEVVNGPVVSVDGPVTIAGTVKDDVVVGRGQLTVDGHVTGDMLVVSGDVLITGRVGGDVVALDGRITVRDGASVRGDVVSREQPKVAAGTVRGKVKKLNVPSLFTGFLVAFLVYLWLAVTVSVAILGLLFVLVLPRAAEASAAAGRRFWATLGWGALVGIVGPILGVLVFVTVVGIPLGAGIVSAFTLLAPLGYVASSLILGRLMVKGPSVGARVGAFFVGFGILRAAALIPGIGFVVWFLVCIYGIGALTQAAWRAGRAPAPAATAAEPPPAGEPPGEADFATVPATSGTTTEPATTEPAPTDAAPTEPAPPD